MRRMMHAAAIAFCLVGFAQAQNPQVRLPSNPSNDPSSLVIGGVESAAIQTIHPAPAAAPPEFIPFGSCRPYSQLAITMNCSDASPALWNNYASERAAIAACINQHVDGTCKCFDRKCNLHATACGPCGNGGCASDGCGGTACDKTKQPLLAKLNRYKVPFSSLYDAPSEACCTTCGGKGGCSSGGCSSNGCSSCGQVEGSMSPIPGTARNPNGPRVANPPVKRLAEPDQGAQRSAANWNPLSGMQR